MTSIYEKNLDAWHATWAYPKSPSHAGEKRPARRDSEPSTGWVFANCWAFLEWEFCCNVKNQWNRPLDVNVQVFFQWFLISGHSVGWFDLVGLSGVYTVDLLYMNIIRVRHMEAAPHFESLRWNPAKKLLQWIWIVGVPTSCPESSGNAANMLVVF